MIEFFDTGKNKMRTQFYEGLFTMKMFRAAINGWRNKGKSLTNLRDYYACMLAVGLADIFDEFETTDEALVTWTCKRCFEERKFPLSMSGFLDSYEENGDLFGLGVKDLLFDLSFNESLLFDYVSAVECFELQPDNVSGLLQQVLSRSKERFCVLPDRNFDVVVPEVSPLLSGVDFPVLVCGLPDDIVVRQKEGVMYLADGDGLVLDVVCVGNFGVCYESLGLRRRFFWRGGEEVASLVCYNYGDIVEARDLLGVDNLLVRCLGEGLVNSGWFVWGVDSLVCAAGHGGFLRNPTERKVKSGIGCSVSGSFVFRVGDWRALRGCSEDECVFSSADLDLIDCLINGRGVGC